MTWTTAVLGYQVTVVSTASVAAMQAAMGAVSLLGGEQQLIGFSLADDVTTAVESVVTRTLTLALNAQFNANLLPGADPKAFFQNLYTQTLFKALVAPVTALPPIVT